MENKFKKFRLIFFLCLGAVVLLAWAVLWLVLSDYESTDYTSAVRRIEENYRTYNGEGILESTRQKINEFETAGDVSRYIKDIVGDKKVEAMLLTSSYGTKNPVYIITLDGQNFSKLTFESEKKSFFGFRKWELKSEEASFSPDKTVSISAPKNARVFINGREMSEQYIDEIGIVLGIYENTPENEYTPLFNTYSISGFYNEPVVTGIGANGEECNVTYDEKYDRINLSTPADEGQLQRATKIVETFSVKYSAYASGDIPFDEVAELIYEGSSIYNDIKNQTLVRFEEHDSYEIKNLEISNAESYDETQINCDVSFDFCYYKEGQEYLYSSSYEMNFIETDKGWKIVNLEVK